MTKIYYFSGTGNSFWSAKKIAHNIGGACAMYNIGKEADRGETVIEADTVVFVFPSYAFGLPVIVRRFIKNSVIKAKYAASFVTFGSSPLGTLGEVRRLLKKKSVEKMYFGKIPSVENYLALFGPPKTETVISRIYLQEKATEDAVSAVKETRENKVSAFTPVSSFVSFLFSLALKTFYKHYKTDARCNGCGFCEKACSVNAIVMEGGRPVFTNKCENCQACVNMCPLRAIQFGRVKAGTPGYRHPGVELIDLVSHT